MVIFFINMRHWYFKSFVKCEILGKVILKRIILIVQVPQDFCYSAFWMLLDFTESACEVVDYVARTIWIDMNCSVQYRDCLHSCALQATNLPYFTTCWNPDFQIV